MLLGEENEKSRKMRNLRSSFFCAGGKNISTHSILAPKKRVPVKEVEGFSDCNGCIDSCIAISISNYVDVLKLYH
jgi:hypothetical protein